MAERKTRSRSFSTTLMTDQQMENIMGKFGHLSESETLRYCVNEVHKMTFPDYIYKRSATDIAKRQKLVAEGEIRALEPISLAEREIGGGLHVTMKGGDDYYLIHTFGNSVWAQPLATLHEDMEEIRDIIALHKKVVEEGKWKLTDRLSKWWVQTFKINNGLEIETIHGEPELTETIRGYYEKEIED